MNPEDIIFLNATEARRLYEQLHHAMTAHASVIGLRSLRFYNHGDGKIVWKVNEWMWEAPTGRRETERTYD